MTQGSNRESRVDELLNDGLEHYGAERVSEAIRCWTAALALDPRNRAARDYLQSTGALDSATLAGLLMGPALDDEPARTTRPWTTVDRELVIKLISARRHEEALEVLRRGALGAPGDVAVERSIRIVEERLEAKYTRRLGSVDRIATRPDGDGRSADLDADERVMLSLVDGRSTLAEILERSPLRSFDSRRALASLIAHDRVQVHPSPTRPHTAVRPRRERRRRPTREFGVTSAPNPPQAVDSAPARVVTSLPREAREVEVEEVFREATAAYVRRDFDVAKRLFEQCLAIDPEHARARFNLERLKARSQGA